MRSGRPEGEKLPQGRRVLPPQQPQCMPLREDGDQIERRIGCDQVEELIEEARDELHLISKMIGWDPWDVPEDYECKVIENDRPIPKHVPQHRPGPLPEEFYKTLEAMASPKPTENIDVSSSGQTTG
ncbi:hypothetical protein QJS04_geneDACA022612 [Acorus gramineus]|uniref:NADH dehydrogenase [ubiquinone] 1 alpha subcomplex subunit 5, mitochondrial n=1 Tax=Acorus gramineus TaxID=55184 RepID=A0AAV9B3P4_ACOGR|nr:hypothetical protein QJS04_geneDACA022612 [Acorus gramineus]